MLGRGRDVSSDDPQKRCGIEPYAGRHETPKSHTRQTSITSSNNFQKDVRGSSSSAFKEWMSNIRLILQWNLFPAKMETTRSESRGLRAMQFCFGLFWAFSLYSGACNDEANCCIKYYRASTMEKLGACVHSLLQKDGEEEAPFNVKGSHIHSSFRRRIKLRQQSEYSWRVGRVCPGRNSNQS